MLIPYYRNTKFKSANIFVIFEVQLPNFIPINISGYTVYASLEPDLISTKITFWYFIMR